MATVADVAKRAGVSVSTAARVLSGTGYASEETRRLVLDAARELGYVPNQIARSLRTRQTRTVGLLVGDVENSFYSVIAKHVEAVAKDAGYHVVLCNSDDDPKVEREYLKLLEGMRVDALIVTPTSKNRRHLATLMDKDIVIVQVDRRVDGLQADAVLVDNEAGAPRGRRAPDRGRAHADRDPDRRLDVPTASQRLAGYERALQGARDQRLVPADQVGIVPPRARDRGRDRADPRPSDPDGDLRREQHPGGGDADRAGPAGPPRPARRLARRRSTTSSG